MKVLIADDEHLARARLRRLLEQLPGCQVLGEAENGEQALQLAAEQRPDVVLMDIRMPLLDGLSAARVLADSEAPPAIVFCTAYDDYAMQAIEASAVAYLLKPVSRDKLEQALQRAQKLNRVQLAALGAEAAPADDARSHICARSNRGMQLIALADVRYFLADQKYVTVYHLHEGQLQETLIDDALKALEEEFPQRFVRVHRNALVALEWVQGLELAGGDHRVRLQGVERGPLVSRRHLPALRKLLHDL